MSQFLVPFILLYGIIQIKPLSIHPEYLTFHVKTFNPESWLDVIITRIYVSAFQLDVKFLTFKKFVLRNLLVFCHSWFGIRYAALRTRLEPTGEANRGQVRRNKAILNETGDMTRLHSTCSCNVKKADSNDETTIVLNNIFK